MFIGKVTGHVVTTQKESGVAQAKLLVVEAYNAAAPGEAGLRPTGRILVAIDTLGAGADDFVLVTQGSSARLTELTKTMPVDAVVIGIVDTVRLHDRVLRSVDGLLDGAGAPAAAREHADGAATDGSIRRSEPRAQRRGKP